MTTVEHMIDLATAYAHAAVRLDRDRRTAMAAEGLTARAGALTAVRKSETAVEQARAALRADLRHALELVVRAVPDAELPVCTWRNGQVEVRGVTDDGSRAVRVRYSAAQALYAGAALIACAAITDQRLGGTLSSILSAFPPDAAASRTPGTESTDETTGGRR